MHLAVAVLLAWFPAAQGGASDAQDPGSPLAHPDGLEVTLWAESPQLLNPTAIDVDERGRLWVTEAVNYRKWRGRNPGLEHPDGDRVVILEDTDADGRCDRSAVFVQERSLVAPLGIAVVPRPTGGRDVYVSCSPHVLRFRDADGDDVPESREVFLTGFGGPDHDHGVHSLVLGADGFLYGAVGNAGPHVVTDASGWTLRSGSLYRGGGEHEADNRPGLVSDDGRVWTGGLIFRVHPRGDGLEVLAHNLRNPYEVALDAWGNLYTADNDDDGNASCRTAWILEGASHGYLSADGTRTWQVDRRPHQGTSVAHWHADDPGVAPPGTITGAGGPTGVAVYEAALLERWIGGAVLSADAGAGRVFVHHPRSAGAGVVLDPGVPLIEGRGEDPAGAWFRPSDVAVGMDGEVFVADWYDPGVGGHAMGDREAYGRILRIAPTGFRPRPEARATGIAAAAVNVRHAAWSAAASVAPEPRTPRDRARALQAAYAAGRTAALERGALEAAAPELRAAAVRLLAPSSEALRVAARDEHPGVRRAVALRLQRRPRVDLELLAALARRLDPGDRYALEAFGLAARADPEAVWARLAPATGERWTPLTRALAWRLHPSAALEGFRGALLDDALPLAERYRMLDAIAFLPGEEAARSMNALALTGPEVLRPLAAFWARHRATNLWRAFELAPELAAHGLEDAERVFRSAEVRSGGVPVEVELEGARTLWLVVTDAGDGNACDWADWLEPRFVTPRGEVRLTDLEWISAEAAWGDVHRNANAVGQPLLVGGDPVAGIGTHADSRIAVAVPPGATRFLARGAVDDGGTTQPGAPTSVVFEVHVENERDLLRFEELEAVLLTGDTPHERRRAARELAADPRGGMRLLRLDARGSLPAEVREAAAGGLARNPDLAVRALAAEAFPSLRAAEEVDPAAILDLKGDARRGAELFFDSRVRCYECHALVRGRARRGGDIGPELTHVREKLAPPAILRAILAPSEEIAFGYETWMIEDDAGDLFVGFLLADGEQVILKDTQGRRHAIDAAAIVDRHRQEISTMPEGLALGLTARDLADLVAFLARDPDRAPVLGPALRLFDGRSLAGWVPFAPESAGGAAAALGVWSASEGVLRCAGSPVGYLRTQAGYEDFVLSLEWRFDPERGPGNSGVLLRLNGPDQVWPRSLEAQLQHGQAGDLWNIERMEAAVAPERTSGRRTRRLGLDSERPLGEWNRYVITLDGERLTLEVNGVQQNEARWCERLRGPIALQSEGAAIEFRNLELREIVGE